MSILQEETREIDDHECEKKCHCYKTCNLIDITEESDLSEEVGD